MRPVALPLLACLGMLSFAPSAWAQGIYKYVEKDGTVVYTNVPPQGAKAQRLKGSFTPAPSQTNSIPKVQMMSAAEYDEYIRVAARRYNLPPALLLAIMHSESNFDPNAVSPKGASGLMQLMPATAQDMYVKDIFDIRENIEGGARYLRVLANQYGGEMVKMVAAYNAGPEAVRKYGGIPPYPETQAYVRKVVALYFQYKEKAKLAEREPAK